MTVKKDPSKTGADSNIQMEAVAQATGVINDTALQKPYLQFKSRPLELLEVCEEEEVDYTVQQEGGVWKLKMWSGNITKVLAVLRR